MATAEHNDHPGANEIPALAGKNAEGRNKYLKCSDHSQYVSLLKKNWSNLRNIYSAFFLSAFFCFVLSRIILCFVLSIHFSVKAYECAFIAVFVCYAPAPPGWPQLQASAGWTAV